MKLQIGFLSMIMLLSPGCQKHRGNNLILSEYYTVDYVDLKDVVSQTGTITPTLKVEIKSEASGKIEKIYVKEGQKVSKGDTLLRIDPSRLITQKEKLQLSIRKAEIDFKMSDRDYNNGLELKNTGSLSEKALQDLELARELAELEYRQQKLEMKDIVDQLGKTVICAPMNGVITALLVEEGEIAVSATSGFQSGTSIGTIADISKLEVVTSVGEVDYVNMKLDQSIIIRSEAIDKSETMGKINFISLSAKREDNSELSRFEIRATVDSLIPGIAPGINVNVDFVIMEKTHIIGVPYHFVRRENNDAYVDIVIKDSEGKEKVTARKISIGSTDFKYYEVRSGLSRGDILVYKPQVDEQSISPGSRGRSK